jgi:hypothetical protein
MYSSMINSSVQKPTCKFKKMRSEKVAAAVFLVGVLFKLMHWPGAGPLIVVSLSIIAVFYFPLAFYFFCDKKIKHQNLPLSIVSGFFLSLIPIGIAFKLQYWPGAQVYTMLGMITSPIILLVTYFLKKRSSEELSVYYENMIKRTSILMVLTTILYFTPASTLIKIQHWDDPELARIKIQYFAHPDNEEFKHQYYDYINRDQ